MRPADVSNYLNEVARLLAINGRCLATFFLLNNEQAALAGKGANALAFDHGEGEWRYVHKHSPESAVAYDESFVMQLVEKYGLAVNQQIYGRWSGREDGYSFQDMLLISHRLHG